jgi:hypothetical protein
MRFFGINTQIKCRICAFDLCQAELRGYKTAIKTADALGRSRLISSQYMSDFGIIYRRKRCQPDQNDSLKHEGWTAKK